MPSFCIFSVFNPPPILPECTRKVRRTIPFGMSGGLSHKQFCFSILSSPYAPFSSSKRLVMLFKPVTRVEPLCSSAPVAGGSMPPTPSAIKSALKPMMKF